MFDLYRQCVWCCVRKQPCLKEDRKPRHIRSSILKRFIYPFSPHFAPLFLDALALSLIKRTGQENSFHRQNLKFQVLTRSRFISLKIAQALFIKGLLSHSAFGQAPLTSFLLQKIPNVAAQQPDKPPIYSCRQLYESHVAVTDISHWIKKEPSTICSLFPKTVFFFH